MGKIFCIMGKSASGKDTIYKKLLADKSLGLCRVVPYTTRPMRTSEKNGGDYFFVSNGRFEEMKAAGRVIESRTYQTVHGPWTYFTADDGQIADRGRYLIVGTLDVYRALQAHFGRDQVSAIYLDMDDGLRLERALARERSQERPDYAEMCRRYLADSKDFSEENLKAAGITKRYQNKDLETCLEAIKKDIL